MRWRRAIISARRCEVRQADDGVWLGETPVVRRAACARCAWKLVLALVAVHARLVGDALVARDDHAAFAGGHDLGGIEAEGAGDAECAGRLCRRASMPCACAASSTSQTPCARQGRASSGIGRRRPPPMCTTIDAAVSRREPPLQLARVDRRTVAGPCPRSTGRAPAWTTAAAVAKNVFAGTSDVASGDVERAQDDLERAVPLLTATAWRTPQ